MSSHFPPAFAAWMVKHSRKHISLVAVNSKNSKNDLIFIKMTSICLIGIIWKVLVSFSSRRLGINQKLS